MSQKKVAPRNKNREDAERLFLDAFDSLLEKGNIDPGVNEVAVEAGLSKVLLYRYFENWEGFLARVAERWNPWRTIVAEVSVRLSSTRPPFSELVKIVFQAYLKALGSSSFRSLLSRELYVHDELTRALETDRELAGLRLVEIIEINYPATEQSKIIKSTLFAGGITWMVLKGYQAGVYNGLPFPSPETEALLLETIIKDLDA